MLIRTILAACKEIAFRVSQATFSMYPKEDRAGYQNGKIHLFNQANPPIAFLPERASAKAMANGQRKPVIAGSAAPVNVFNQCVYSVGSQVL